LWFGKTDFVCNYLTVWLHGDPDRALTQIPDITLLAESGVVIKILLKCQNACLSHVIDFEAVNCASGRTTNTTMKRS
jgi:hypothetical protein